MQLLALMVLPLFYTKNWHADLEFACKFCFLVIVCVCLVCFLFVCFSVWLVWFVAWLVGWSE